jgi:hypothetical protein
MAGGYVVQTAVALSQRRTSSLSDALTIGWRKGVEPQQLSAPSPGTRSDSRNQRPSDVLAQRTRVVRVGPRVPTPPPAFTGPGLCVSGPGYPFPPCPHANGAARGMVKLITLCIVGIAALAIVGGLFVAVCIESLIAPKDDPS